MPYGRADVATDTHVIEVEPYTSWRHGIRQALAYASQAPHLVPGLALFGAANSDDVLALHLRLRAVGRSHPGPHVALWWYDRGWQEITTQGDCRKMHEAQPRTCMLCDAWVRTPGVMFCADHAPPW